MQVVHFHSSARETEPIVIRKGRSCYSDQLGILRPEYNPKGLINQKVVCLLVKKDKKTGKLVPRYDNIIFAGQAGSHCVLETVRQIAEEFASLPGFTQRLIVLSDCMSPVNEEFRQPMLDGFDELVRVHGVQLKSSTDLVL